MKTGYLIFSLVMGLFLMTAGEVTDFYELKGLGVSDSSMTSINIQLVEGGEYLFVADSLKF